MESSTKVPLLDQYGKPFPDDIQRVLDELVPRLRRKFPIIRDEVVLVEILEQAGRQIVDHLQEEGPIERLYGFAWVTLRNVAISRLRRSPHLLKESRVRSVDALARLSASQSGPAEIEYEILLREVLSRLSPRERFIAIRKKAGFSSQEIGEHIGMSVSAVDTTFWRIRRKVQKLLRPESECD